MRIMYDNAPLKSSRIQCYDTSDATMIASDLQSGVTAWAKGKKVTGTGKSFEFAQYGGLRTNLAQYIPTGINVIEVASTEYPIQLNIALSNMSDVDFSAPQNIGTVTIDDVTYSLTAQAVGNILTISCDKTITLEAFYGKDNYV